MNFRVTSASFAERAIQSSSVHRSNLVRLQTQISSGSRFQRPSEAPTAFRQLTALNRRFTELNADRSAIDQATSVLNASVHQIQEYNDIITAAKGMTQQAIQAMDQKERSAFAFEVEGLLGRLKSVGLAQFNGRYLFGGTRSDQRPFEFSNTADTHRSLRVAYQGSTQRSRAMIGDSLSVDTYYDGQAVFANAGRESTVLIGQTGARAGKGTDTEIGQVSLRVSHENTSYIGASGVRAGASSSGGDTIIGEAGVHRLTLVDTSGDGSFGTVRLNGGSPVSFTSADTDLRVESANGQVVYVDTTGISPGFDGEVEMVAIGRLSIDNGATSSRIEFSDSQVVADVESGRAITVDSTRITKTGVDYLEFPGTSNAFQVLDELVGDLRNTRELSPQELAQSLGRRLADLERLHENALSVMGEQSTSLRTLSAVGEKVEDLKVATEIQMSDLQATDIPQAMLDLRTSQSLLQYTYAVSAELMSMDLLQFLR